MFINIVVSNLDTKSDINKKMEQKFDSLDLQGYYAGLTKKEKSSLLSYLTKEYDMTCSTIRRKLAGNQGFGLNTLERMACHEAIKNENLWRH